MHVFVCVLLVPVVDGLHLSLLIGAAAAAFETDSLSLSLSLHRPNYPRHRVVSCFDETF